MASLTVSFAYVIGHVPDAVLRITDSLAPSEDPFYTAPKNYESAAPGTILRIRSTPGNLRTVVANSSAAYNILYRTTDSRYNASWAVTTLFVPSSPDLRSPALLSYQIAYDTADLDASPSYALYNNPPTNVALALGNGWWVNVPDYEGPLASFSAGVQSGHATLDSVRAVLSSGFGLPSNAAYAMWRYSGGSIASEWAAELQVQYTPELNFSGVALGGLVPNATSTLNTVTGTVGAGLIPAGILGILIQYPEVQDYVLSQLKPTGPYNATTFLSSRNMSLYQALKTFAGQNIWDYFINGSAILNEAITQKMINNDLFMGYHGVPQMPIFVYKAIADEFSPIADTDALVSKYCAVGANTLYHRNTVGEHITEAANEDGNALMFLSSVFTGTWAQSDFSQGCTLLNVTVNVTSSSI